MIYLILATTGMALKDEKGVGNGGGCLDNCTIWWREWGEMREKREWMRGRACVDGVKWKWRDFLCSNCVFLVELFFLCRTNAIFFCQCSNCASCWVQSICPVLPTIGPIAFPYIKKAQYVVHLYGGGYQKLPICRILVYGPVQCTGENMCIENNYFFISYIFLS